MLALLLYAVCRAFANMRAMKILPDSGFDISLAYLACCHCRDRDFLQCSSALESSYFSIFDGYDVPLRGSSSFCCPSADWEPVAD